MMALSKDILALMLVRKKERSKTWSRIKRKRILRVDNTKRVKTQKVIGTAKKILRRRNRLKRTGLKSRISLSIKRRRLSPILSVVKMILSP